MNAQLRRVIYLFFWACVLSTRLIAQQQTPTVAPVATDTEKAPPLSGAAQAKIAKMTPLFDGKTLDGWVCSTNSWTIKDGAMASLGAGRGVIYTQREFANYRVIFTMRHVSGKPDHEACVLIYGTTPPAGQKGLDALGAIQFQPPNGGHWDYRPGHNNSGKELFTRIPHPKFNSHEWAQVELLVNTNGTARMAVAQPVGARAVEVLAFNDPTAGKPGPIAWQMHNKGLFDEYKDVRIEENPSQNRLITTE